MEAYNPDRHDNTVTPPQDADFSILEDLQIQQESDAALEKQEQERKNETAKYLADSRARYEEILNKYGIVPEELKDNDIETQEEIIFGVFEQEYPGLLEQTEIEPKYQQAATDLILNYLLKTSTANNRIDPFIGEITTIFPSNLQDSKAHELGIMIYDENGELCKDITLTELQLSAQIADTEANLAAEIQKLTTSLTPRIEGRIDEKGSISGAHIAELARLTRKYSASDPTDEEFDEFIAQTTLDYALDYVTPSQERPMSYGEYDLLTFDYIEHSHSKTDMPDPLDQLILQHPTEKLKSLQRAAANYPFKSFAPAQSAEDYDKVRASLEQYYSEANGEQTEAANEDKAITYAKILSQLTANIDRNSTKQEKSLVVDQIQWLRDQVSSTEGRLAVVNQAQKTITRAGEQVSRLFTGLEELPQGRSVTEIGAENLSKALAGDVENYSIDNLIDDLATVHNETFMRAYPALREKIRSDRQLSKLTRSEIILYLDDIRVFQDDGYLLTRIIGQNNEDVRQALVAGYEQLSRQSTELLPQENKELQDQLVSLVLKQVEQQANAPKNASEAKSYKELVEGIIPISSIYYLLAENEQGEAQVKYPNLLQVIKESEDYKEELAAKPIVTEIEKRKADADVVEIIKQYSETLGFSEQTTAFMLAEHYNSSLRANAAFMLKDAENASALRAIENYLSTGEKTTDQLLEDGQTLLFAIDITSAKRNLRKTPTDENMPRSKQYAKQIANKPMLLRDIIRDSIRTNHAQFYEAYRNNPQASLNEILKIAGLEEIAILDSYIETHESSDSSEAIDLILEYITTDSRTNQKYLDEKNLAISLLSSTEISLKNYLEQSSEDFSKLTPDNILEALAIHLTMDAEDWTQAEEFPNIANLKKEFQTSEVKKLALDKARSLLSEFLREPQQQTTELKTITKTLEINEAGPLTQIGNTIAYAAAIREALQGNKLQEEEKEQLLSYIRTIERTVFKDGGWDDMERSNYYGVASEITAITPGGFMEFAKVFAEGGLQRKQTKALLEEIMPLFRAKLLLMGTNKNIDDDGVGSGHTEIKYSGEELEEIRRDAHNILLPFHLSSEHTSASAIDIVRSSLIKEITTRMQEKFGINSSIIPESFSKKQSEMTRSAIIYLGNLANADQTKRETLGFMTATMLENDGEGWTKLRSGAKIDIDDYVSTESNGMIQEAISQSRAETIKSITSAGLPQEKAADFLADLQTEQSNSFIGNVSTVDIKLANAIAAISELTDPDHYARSQYDMAQVKLIQKYQGSIKRLGAVAATLYRNAGGANIPLSGEDYQIAQDMLAMLQEQNIEPTQGNIKVNLQVGPFATKKTIFDTYHTLTTSEGKNISAVDTITELQKTLIPTDETIRIFQKIGIDFETNSGAIAIDSDIQYLSEAISAKKNALSQEELEQANAYLDSINEKLTQIQAQFNKLKMNLAKTRKAYQQQLEAGDSSVESEIAAIDAIESILDQQEAQKTIVSTCTNDFNAMMPNMRACLSMSTAGINNDTNLTFAAPDKFYLYSTTNKKSNNISDEIVFCAPTKTGNEETRFSAIMDMVYGAANEQILTNHARVAIRKMYSLKQKYPEARFSVTIPTTTFTSASTSIENLTAERLLDELPSDIDTSRIRLEIRDNITATIPYNQFSEHYVEFGGGNARTNGGDDTNFTGLEILID